MMYKKHVGRSLIVALLLSGSLTMNAQKITRQFKNVPLKIVLEEVEKQLQYSVIYKKDEVNEKKQITRNFKDASLEDVLSAVLDGNLTYSIQGKMIVISKKGVSGSLQQKQQKKITGIVKDEQGEPIAGANIVEKGTTNGTITDMNGGFSLDVPDDAILQVSYIGYLVQDIPIKNKTTVSVNLKEDALSLDEVVVVGYGSQKKVNLTGSVASVKIDEHLTSRSTVSTSSALNGLVPGLMVQQATGMAGKDGAVLRVRGLGTVNNSDPLIVVDGMPDVDMNRIDMNDIETISVLKDASSSAIYGSRAANGVILITTKKGKEGKVNISYSGNVSVGRTTGFYEYLDDYPRALSLHNQAAMNGGNALTFRDGTIDEWFAKGMVDPILYPNTDWYDIIFRSPLIQNHSLSATGGTDKGSFYISASYLNQEGVLFTNDFDRLSFRTNLDQKITNTIKVGVNLVGQWSNQTYPWSDGMVAFGENSTYDGIIRSVAGILPQDPVTGEYGGAMAYGEDTFAHNMQSFFESSKNKTVRKDFNGLGYIEWKPIDWLQFRADYGLTYRNDFIKSYNMPTTWQNFQTGLPGLEYIAKSTGVTDVTQEWYKTLFNAQVTFDKEIVQGHNLRFQAIYSEEYWHERNQKSGRTKRWNPNLHEVNAAESESQTAQGTSSSEGLCSVLGKLNYEIHDKYLLQALVRFDGSSKFTKGHQWGVFPSVSAGWRFSEESFFEPIKKIVNSGKLKASWGQVGNNSGVGRYDQKDTYGASFYNFGGSLSSGYSSTKIIDPDFTWETTTILNGGLELSFLDSRLRTEFDLYNKTTTGMIRPGQISRFLSGYSAPKMNIGELRNSGFEVTFSWQDAIEDFSYGAVLNYAYNRNKLLKWNQRLGRGYAFIGYPYNMVHTYVAKGIVQSWDEIDNSAFQNDNIAPGDVLMEDINGDGYIDSSDQVTMPNANRRIPSNDFSLNLNAAWKGFDISIFFQGNAGRKDFWRDEFNRVDIYNTRYAFQKHHLDSWSLENRNASLPRLVTGNSGGYRQDYSTYWLYSCDYIRLKNMQLGYTFSKSLLKHVGVNSLRLYVSGDNLLTITNWPGLDPEKIPTYESELNPYPLVQTFSFGINIVL